MSESFQENESDFNSNNTKQTKQALSQTDDDGKIKIILSGNHENRITCKVNPNAKVSKLLNAYCKQTNVNAKEYRIVYMGKVLQENQEISAYNITDGTRLEVVASQTGGCFY